MDDDADEPPPPSYRVLDRRGGYVGTIVLCNTALGRLVVRWAGQTTKFELSNEEFSRLLRDNVAGFVRPSRRIK